MFGLFRRPKLVAHFAASRAVSEEFARQISLTGRLNVTNEGDDAELAGTELIVIAGFRRIPLEVPLEWRSLRLPAGGRKEGEVSWSLTLDAPLRAQAGELYVAILDQRRRKWEWRLPFTFEQR